eukprot:scaffold41771_cov32-Tisochrysis_lutea.AAC.3
MFKFLHAVRFYAPNPLSPHPPSRTTVSLQPLAASLRCGACQSAATTQSSTPPPIPNTHIPAVFSHLMWLI